MLVLGADASLEEKIDASTRSEGVSCEHLHSALSCVDRLRRLDIACVIVDRTHAARLFEHLDAELIDAPLVLIGGGVFDSRKVPAPIVASVCRCLDVDFQAEELQIAIREAVDEARRRLADRQAVEEYHEGVRSLSAAELRVMQAVCEGKLNKQIASELGVSIRTVEQRRSRVFSKMSVESAVPLAARRSMVRTIERLRPQLAKQVHRVDAAGGAR
ncbi:MAG: LuxR C-terminal-related transcriptional regulator [Planctomycetota bacterium]